MTPEVRRARWQLGAAVAAVVLGLGLMIAGFVLTDAHRDRDVARLLNVIDLLEANRLALHEQLRVRDDAAVEYDAKRCRLAVALGQHDDFLRELGWQRGGAR